MCIRPRLSVEELLLCAHDRVRPEIDVAELVFPHLLDVAPLAETDGEDSLFIRPRVCRPNLMFDWLPARLLSV